MGHLINVGTGLPTEPGTGTVLELVVSFDGPSPERTYRYLAFRADHDNWYVTGQAGEFSWRRVWENLAGAYLVEAHVLVRDPLGAPAW